MTPQELAEYQRRMRGMSRPGQPLPMLSGVPMGANVTGRPAPSTGGVNLDQALMPPDWMANRPPGAGQDPIWDVLKKSFSPDWSQFQPGQPQAPQAPQAPSPIGMPPQMAPQGDPAMRQMNYGDLADPSAGQADPNAMPDQSAGPVPFPIPRPSLAPPTRQMAQRAAPPGVQNWPPVPQPRPDQPMPDMPVDGLPVQGADGGAMPPPTGPGSANALGPQTYGDAAPAAEPSVTDRLAAAWNSATGKFDTEAGKTLMNFGLGVLANNRPGASFASAVGGGGLAAMQQADRDRRLKVQEGQLARQEARDNRRLSLDEQKLVQDAELRRQQWIEQANRADLDREARVQAARDAQETRRLQIELQRGNAQASAELRALIAQGSIATRQDANRIREEDNANRQADRAEARDQRAQQEAQRQQDLVDNRAAEAARRHVESLRNKATGQLPPDAAQQEDEFIKRNFPKSTRAQDLLAQPVELPTTDVEISPASGGFLGIGGTPAQTKKQIDRKALVKGQTYLTPQGPLRFDGKEMVPVE